MIFQILIRIFEVLKKRFSVSKSDNKIGSDTAYVGLISPPLVHSTSEKP